MVLHHQRAWKVFRRHPLAGLFLFSLLDLAGRFQGIEQRRLAVVMLALYHASIPCIRVLFKISDHFFVIVGEMCGNIS
jgi:hypothetical protein